MNLEEFEFVLKASRYMYVRILIYQVWVIRRTKYACSTELVFPFAQLAFVVSRYS